MLLLLFTGRRIIPKAEKHISLLQVRGNSNNTYNSGGGTKLNKKVFDWPLKLKVERLYLTSGPS